MLLCYFYLLSTYNTQLSYNTQYLLIVQHFACKYSKRLIQYIFQMNVHLSIIVNTFLQQRNDFFYLLFLAVLYYTGFTG